MAYAVQIDNVVIQLDFLHWVRSHHFGEAWMCVSLWHISCTSL